MTAVLGNMVPPDNGGAAAVNNLVAILERLVNKIDGATGGGSSSGGTGGAKTPKDPAVKLNKQWENFTNKIEKEFNVFGTVGKTSAGTIARLRYEFDKLNKSFTAAGLSTRAGSDAWVSLRRLEKAASSQSAAKMGPTTAGRDKQAEELDKLERKWLKREKTDRENAAKNKLASQNDQYRLDDEVNKITIAAQDRLKAHRAKNQKAVTKVVDTLNKLMEDITDRLNEGAVLKLRDYRRLARAGAKGSKILNVRSLSNQNKATKDAEKLQKQNESDDAYGLRLAKDASYKLRQRREKEAKADQDRLAKEAAAITQSKIDAAQRELRFRREMQIKNRYGTGTSIADLKKAERIGSPLASAIEDQLAKKKADKDKGGSNFFGGFGRNLIIGQIYRAAHEAMAPFLGLVQGLISPVAKGWGSFTSAMTDAGKSLSYLAGIGEVASRLQSEMDIYVARFRKQNSLMEMGFNVGGRAAAGIAGVGASVTSGLSGALGGVFSNPIQGILDIAGKIGGAVSLFDPSTMMRFGMVMREVTAVIGMGLTPVMQTITSLIKEFGDYLKPVVQDLGGEFAAAIRELGKELKPLVKLLIVELRNSLQDFTDKLKQLNKQGNLDIGGVANELGAGPRQVNQRRLAIAGGGALAGAGIGAFAGPPGALIGGGIGGLVGMLGADQLAPQWPGKRANGQELMAAANNLKKGQLMGTAVAHNATIGSGADLARRAAQDAFIASSNNGLAEGKNLFEVAAQKAIDFFNKNNQPPVVNGNAQPGVANGQGPIAQAGDLWAAFGGAAKAQLGFK